MGKRPLSVRIPNRKHTGNVLPKRPLQTTLRKTIHNPNIVGEQSRLAMLKARPATGHTETLARAPTRQHVDGRN
ncbi:MAG TPA: hypothetical protein VIG24_02955, partial [Acidimicrobiia bacterium]